ncbi:MAG: hypothetical protein HQL29_03030 [Candidatus Omnitrophica bacterium]|nr:hypothetical protein [Candidatus Omnitrophota bacterium]
MKTILFRNIITTTLIALFSWVQVMPAYSSQNLAGWLSSDDSPMRDTQVEVAKKLEPGAIGNGRPLVGLLKNGTSNIDKLVVKTDYDADILRKVREATKIAIQLYLSNKSQIPVGHQERSEQASLQLSLLNQFLSEKLFIFNAIIEGEEDYLLGFNYQDNIGLSVELIELLYPLSPELLAQYIFHECVPEHLKTEEGDYGVDRTDHRVVYNEIQSKVFGEIRTKQLGEILRLFINNRGNISFLTEIARTAIKKNELIADIVGALDNDSRVKLLAETLAEQIRALNLPSRDSTFIFSGAIAKLTNNTRLYETYAVPEYMEGIQAIEAVVRSTFAEYGVNLNSDVLKKVKDMVNNTWIDEALRAEQVPYQAEVFKNNILSAILQNPDKVFGVALDTELGDNGVDNNQKQAIEPIWDAIKEVQTLLKSMRHPDGSTFDNNLRVVWGKGSNGQLIREIEGLGDGVQKQNIVMVLKNSNLGTFSSYKDVSWITAIDDSMMTAMLENEGAYIPTFESITLNLMALQKSDIESIKSLYDSLANRPIAIEELKAMLATKVIRILPKMNRKNLKLLREENEAIARIYLSA